MKKLLSLALCLILMLALVLQVSALQTVPVKSISVSGGTSISMNTGTTRNLAIVFSPTNTTQKQLIFSTSDSNIATVDASGRIKALKAGTVTVTVTSSSNKKVTVKCKVTVVQPKPTQITIWVHPFIGDEKRAQEQNDMWNDYAKRFTTENPNTTVKWQMIPWANRDQRMLTAFSAGKSPDIVYLIIDHLSQFGAMGIIEPLDRYITPEVKSDYLSSALNSTTIDGHVYGLPWLQTVMTYVYNLDILANAGCDTVNLPQTWAQMDGVLKKVKAAGKVGINFEGGSNANLVYYPYLWQAGGDVLDKSGKVIFDSPAAVKSLNRVVDMYKNGYISKDSVTSTATTALWEGGELACYFTDNATIYNYIYGATKLNFKFAVGPVLQDAAKATFGTVGSWCISKTSTKKDAAAKLILFLTRSDNMKIFLDKTGYMPPRKSLSDMYQSMPQIDFMVKQCLPYTKPGVVHPAGRQITSVTLPAMWQAAMLEQKTTQQAIKDTIDPINKAIADSLALKPE